jgi:hypothetical protein
VICDLRFAIQYCQCCSYNVGAGLGRVIAVVGATRNIGDGASGRWNPKVGRASVEHNQELLWWSTKSDGTVVLGLAKHQQQRVLVTHAQRHKIGFDSHTSS